MSDDSVRVKEVFPAVVGQAAEKRAARRWGDGL
jgi:hypothetical protein